MHPGEIRTRNLSKRAALDREATGIDEKSKWRPQYFYQPTERLLSDIECKQHSSAVELTRPEEYQFYM
jgi:hypothetical protein